MPKNGYYFDTIEKVEGLEPTGRGRHALGCALPDPERARYPMATDDELRFVEHQARFLYQETDKALMGDFHLNITEIGSFEDWFVLLVTEPAYVSEFYGKQTESIIENLTLYYQASGTG